MQVDVGVTSTAVSGVLLILVWSSMLIVSIFSFKLGGKEVSVSISDFGCLLIIVMFALAGFGIWAGHSIVWTIP